MIPTDGLRESWSRVAAIELDHAHVGIVWVAHDRVADTVYLYDCLIQPRGNIAVLAATLKDKGKWIPVLFDHARWEEEDGVRIAERLAGFDLDVVTAQVNPELAATEMNIRLGSGRLKVFDHLDAWFREYRLYRRDDTGKIASEDCRLIGATGLVMMHIGMAVSEAKAMSDMVGPYNQPLQRTGADSMTGY